MLSIKSSDSRCRFHKGFGLFCIVLVWALCSEPARADDETYGGAVVLIRSTSSSSGDGTITIDLELDWWPDGCDECSSSPPLNDPIVTVIITDCEGEKIEQELPLTLPPCPDQSTGTFPFQFSAPCPPRYESYEIQVERETWDYDCFPTAGPPETLDEGELDNKLSCYDLDSGDCGTPTQSGVSPGSDVYRFYKKIDTLYTLPTSDRSGASLGEIVDGEFKAPSDGVLRIKNIKGDSDAVNMFADGWYTAGGRGGERVNTDQCVQLEEGKSYKFNVLAGRSDLVSEFSADFEWYWWNSTDCKPEKDNTINLQLTIKPLDAYLDPVTPPRPRRYDDVRLSDEQKWTQICRPHCPDCSSGSNQCSIGNMTEWFVPWPSTSGNAIEDGHAKGWKIVGNTLIDPSEQVYQFSH